MRGAAGVVHPSVFALSICTMPSAKTTCLCKSPATFSFAHFGAGAAMPATQSSCSSRSCAIVKQADLSGAAAVFGAETLASRGGGAARHRARLLLLPAAVCDAMLESMCCRGGASIDLAPAIRTMPIATAACSSRSIAALNVAHFRAATAMPCTQSS